MPSFSFNVSLTLPPVRSKPTVLRTVTFLTTWPIMLVLVHQNSILTVDGALLGSEAAASGCFFLSVLPALRGFLLANSRSILERNLSKVSSLDSLTIFTGVKESGKVLNNLDYVHSSPTWEPNDARYLRIYGTDGDSPFNRRRLLIVTIQVLRKEWL